MEEWWIFLGNTNIRKQNQQLLYSVASKMLPRLTFYWYTLLEVGTQYLATFGFFFWGTISFCDTTAASIETKGDGVDNKYQTNNVPVHVDVGIAFPGRSSLTN